MPPSLAAIDRHFERLVADLGPPRCSLCKEPLPKHALHICEEMWAAIEHLLYRDEWPIRAPGARR